jgi:hypothetical protein
MDALTPYATALLRDEIARQLGDIELAGELTKIALQEITGLHEYGVKKVATTLKEAHQVIKRAGNQSLSQGQHQQLHQQTVAYLEEMFDITRYGSWQIMEILRLYSPRR